MEIVGVDVCLVHLSVDIVESRLIAYGDYCQFVVEMVEYDYVSIENIHHVGSIVSFHGCILYGDVLEIAYRVESCVTVKPTVKGVFAFYLKAFDE